MRRNGNRLALPVSVAGLYTSVTQKLGVMKLLTKYKLLAPLFQVRETECLMAAEEFRFSAALFQILAPIARPEP